MRLDRLANLDTTQSGLVDIADSFAALDLNSVEEANELPWRHIADDETPILLQPLGQVEEVVASRRTLRSPA